MRSSVARRQGGQAERMSDQNLKPMNKEELEKHIEKDFLPILLSTFPNISDLVLENARLQAEVERLTFDPLTYLDDQGEWMPRHIHLAAVERLQAEVESVRQVAQDNKTETEATRIENTNLKAELTDCKVKADRLKAEVERLRNLATKIDAYVDVLVFENGWLRKAGDDAAKAAMESKQPPNEPSV